MKAKFNNSILTVLAMTTLMACSTSRNATAQYPNSSDEYGNYDDRDYAYEGDDEYYDEPSEADVNMDVFVNELSPYGRWVNSPSYGQVWICNEAGFVPYYSGGRWAYTNYGWTWASNYRWGWAPFHYGRWAYDPFYGWMWVPGYQWGPAWVGWRTGGDYYGWAPLGPGMNISVGFNFGGIPANNWCFVPRRYMGYSNFNRYAVNRSRNVTIIRNTTIINNTNIYRNTRYATGPNRTEVERFTGRRVNELRVNNRPGASRVTNNNTINIYRPQINKKVDVDKRVNNNNQSHDADNPNRNPRIIRTPEKRNDNKNVPDQRDKINDNRNNNNNNRDINRDRNNNDGRRDNDINNRPPQKNDNRFPDRNFNNRNEQRIPDNNRPQQDWNNNRNNSQDRNFNQRPDFNRNNQNQDRNFDQRPDFNRNRDNGNSWQPAPQQQRNMPAKPAPQQNNNKRKPA